jgi:hypothetical protein
MSDLSDLIRLGFVSFLLNVDFLFDSFLSEDVMTAADAHLEAQAMQEVTQVVKRNTGVGLATQDSSDQPLVFPHDLTLLFPPTQGKTERLIVRFRKRSSPRVSQSIRHEKRGKSVARHSCAP